MTINVAAAWLTGKLHSKCQDKVNACRGKIYIHSYIDEQTRIESDYGLVVLSDGAGSKEYSATGAFTATRSVEKFFTQIYDWKSFDEYNIEEIKVELLQYIIGEISSVASSDDNISDYACTLLFVLYIGASRKYIYGHIGDGGIVGLEDDTLSIISEPENGEYKNQTYFITDKDAVDFFHLGIGSKKSEQLGFLLCTDGVSSSLFKSTRAGQVISPVCQTFCQWLMSAESEEDIITVSKAYRDNLQKYFSPMSKDDLSLGVMTVS